MDFSSRLSISAKHWIPSSGQKKKKYNFFSDIVPGLVMGHVRYMTEVLHLNLVFLISRQHGKEAQTLEYSKPRFKPCTIRYEEEQAVLHSKSLFSYFDEQWVNVSLVSSLVLGM